MQWKFVGRTTEVERLLALINGGDRGVVLAGQAGVGKTRLAMECLQRVNERFYSSIHVSASRSAGAIPLGAFASLLPVAEDSQRKLPESRAEMLREAAANLVAQANDRRLVLLVDDAHLLDDASATLVYQLAAADSAFVLATVRSAASAPDPIVALWKDELVDRIQLEGLSHGAIAEVISGAIEGQIDPAVHARLAERCQGNILYLRELLLGAVADRSLTNETGIWRLAGPLTPSERLVELVETRMDGLGPDERTLLELVSWGEPLEITELSMMADLADTERLERLGFLNSRAESGRLEVRMAHPVYADVVRARTPALRVSRLATTLADTLEAQDSKHPRDILRIAIWRLHGGGGSPDRMLEAAVMAQDRYDFALAEELAQRALEVGAGFDAALLLAALATQQGRISEGRQRLLSLTGEAENDMERGRVALALLDSLGFYSGLVDEGLEIGENALANIADPHWRDEISARQGGLALVEGGPRRGFSSVESLLNHPSARTLTWACQVGSASLARLGRFRQALDVADRGYAAATSLPRSSDWLPFIHVYLRCKALGASGSLDEALRLGEEQYSTAFAEGSVEAQAWFAWALTTWVVERGNAPAATCYGKESVALFRQLGRPIMEYHALSSFALALAVNNRASDAQGVLAQLDSLNLPTPLINGIDVFLARAWTAVAADDRPQARKLLTEATEVAEDIGDLVGAVNALHLQARLGSAKAVEARLASLATQVEGELVAAHLRHTTALAADAPDELDAVAASYHRMGAYLLATEAAADAAALWRKIGDSRRATASEFRAAASAEHCGGTDSLLLRDTALRGMLTPAERETALLAAGGRSNKVIADKLHLSVRTVEGRLQRVYEKLDISSRSQLAAVLKTM